ncbi:hypothetical protein PF008_g23908 [Phytophthora fragariae]|uniref:Uncharacterized protein n=3 Tax=Phytophthora TaxID=4783 RepID=A0A6G0QQ34_9STRA|nr:hypothetical protein PF008_g23908 [Phytophthora fragariae]
MLLEMSLVEAVLEFEGGEVVSGGVCGVRGTDMFVDMFVDDGGIPTTKFVDMPCNQNSVNQVFKDNIKTGEIESVNKPGMRIDDGGAVSAAINTTMSRL